MPFIEAPTTFYLGRRYDPATHRLTDDVVYYDSRDLTTHAVVVGMTGSGKTGLCITLLEEAILDNIPAIVVDPKGDITNLLLNFPDLKPEDFQPWVNVDDARRAGLDLPSYAADVAQRWRDGLASWGIVPDRMRWLKQIAQYNIYTPGSDAGLPISILASLRAPREGWAGNEEALRERINGIVTALLALIGIDAQPVKDREHVLVANIFEYAWRQGRDLTLDDIILQVQKPPFNKLGVFSIDDYMPEKARVKLAMEMNNIIAAPSFQSWLQGEPLDIQNLLYQRDGRARVSIFYIAHLSEAERQFMITLLLENVLGWMRSLSGTTSLRALFYVDEMFGYFPPYPRNPPTKEPMLRLLKQARAFGLGMILATQNPGDLDYKGLSNAGTWFIGRLQSVNDRDKVMAGLESLASAESGLNLKDVERLITDIEPRVFLMHNVHDTGDPLLVHTRWVMSYLRGPLTRQQVQALMAGQRQKLYAQLAAVGQGGPYAPQGFTAPPAFIPGAPPPPPEVPGFTTQAATPPPAPPGNFQQGFTQQATVPVSQAVPLPKPGGSQATVQGVAAPPGFTDKQPPIASTTAQYFLPNTVTSQQAIGGWERQTNFSAQTLGGVVLAYKPVLLAQAVVRYQDRKTQLFLARTYTFHVPGLERSGIVHWEEFVAVPIEPKRVSGEPFTTAVYGELPPGLTDSKRLTSLRGELVDLLYNTATLKVPFNPTLTVYGNPDASESEYYAQVQQVAHEKRDAEIDQLAAKYEKIMDRLDDRMRRKARELEAEKKELSSRKREELFTQGEAILSLLRGRTTYTLSRTSRAHRYSQQTREDLRESEQVLAEIEAEMQKLEEQFQAELRVVNDKWAKIAADKQEYVITPFKKDIQIELYGIGWIPFWFAEVNQQPLMLPAFV